MSAVQIACPQCDQLVNLQERYCTNCHVDLALAAALAEHEITPAEWPFAGTPVTPEILVPRLGEYLVEKEHITQSQLEQGLVYQHEQANQGRSIVIGHSLRELGLVSQEILDQAITVQILELQSALQRANRDLEQRVQERTRKLEQAVDKWKELSQVKANFIANVSHELRTPLTHIKGYLDLMGSGELGPLTESQRQAITVIVRSEERLERVIDELIQFSLVSRGELTLNRGPVDLAEIIRIVLHQARQKASHADVQLQVEMAPILSKAFCDEEKTAWVISQLLDNGIKFTPAGGQVLVSVRQMDSQIYVEVRDTGIGIPKDRLSELFEPFHQLDGSSSRRFSGTGLGLALSKRIMNAQDSDLSVESTPGKGTSFKITFPILADEEGDSSNV